MKKGQIYEGTVIDIDFPDKGVVLTKETNKDGIVNEHHVIVKGALPGQTVRYILQKARAGKCKGRLLEVINKSSFETAKPECANFGVCGGCSYQTLPYKAQLELKKNQVLKLINGVAGENSYIFDGIFPSPCIWGYRNKMEFSFGDEYKGGPLSLGLHKKGSIHDIINASGCRIVNNDYSKILDCIREYFFKRNIPHYNKNTHTGILRHLLIRRSASTGEILVALVTASGLENYMCGEDGSIVQDKCSADDNNTFCNVIDCKNASYMDMHNSPEDSTNTSIQKRNEKPGDNLSCNNICLREQDKNNITQDKQGADNIDKSEKSENYKNCLYGLGTELQHLQLEGRITGFLHIINNGLGDVVKSDETHIIFGKDWITEEILGLKFRISVFSFFQTNTKGAEVLYSCARNYIYGKPAYGMGNLMRIYGIQYGTGDFEKEDSICIPEGKNQENTVKNINKVLKENTGEINIDVASVDISGNILKGNMEINTDNNLEEIETQNIETDNFLEDKIVFDLYSGTGTIAQIIAPVAKKVTGVEIVEEAVEAARQNAEYNGLKNCEFIAGDVLKVLEEIDEKPGFIILDPPREGVHPKALKKICEEIKIPEMVYISCKPTSLARDITELQKYGYSIRRLCCVDMFPQTTHVECVCLLHRTDS